MYEQKIEALKKERAKAVTELRAVQSKAETEKRDTTSDENQQIDKMLADCKRLEGDSARLEAMERESAWANDRQGRKADSDQPGTDNQPEQWRTAGERRASKSYGSMFGKYLLGGQTAIRAGGLTPQESRALQAEDDVGGGFLVAPQQFVNELIAAVNNMVFVRQAGARVFSVPSAESLGAPSLDTDINDADWTGEIVSATEDTALAFGKRELRPKYLSKLVKVSNPLIRKTSADAIVRDRLAYKFAVTEEKGFLTGDGASQPLGVFTASAQGISTSRDVSTGNTTTSITFDGLIEAKFSLKGQYWTAAQWLFHRDALKQITKLKDGDGQYIWRESTRVGEPDRLLGLPYMMSEYAPNTFTTGLYVGILGDFRNYWIADALDLSVQVLVELYAATNQTGYIGRKETDGMPVLEEAFARVKLA